MSASEVQPSPATRHPPPATRSVGELLLALVVIVVGALIVWQTTQIRLTPAYAKVGPRVIPYIVGAGFLVIGAWLAVAAWRGETGAVSAESEDADPTLPTDWRCLAELVAVLLAYLVLLERAGFVIASALLFAGAAIAMGSRHYPRDVAVGIVLALVLYLGFTRGLDLRLPAGVLAGIL